MARPSTRDPLDRFRWAVAIRLDGQETFTRMGFTSVETPQVSIDTKSYPEGGNHLFPKQIIEGVSFKPITLRRGVTQSTDFDSWAKQYIELIQGRRQDEAIETFGGFDANGLFESLDVKIAPADYRREVSIGHLDREGNLIKIYRLYNAFPILYKTASDFDASADDELSIETLTLAYESFDVQSIEDRTDNPLDPRDVFKRLTRRAF